MDKTKENDPYLMDHNYDGIEELDNPMPTWWLITFFATIIFGVIYYLHYEVTQSSTSDQELALELAEIEKIRNANTSEQPPSSPQDLQALIGDSSAISGGDKVYQAKCASCHGAKGEGLIGPNLTDDHWIHGDGKIESLVQVINAGVLDKGMPAWKDLIAQNDIQKIGAYLISLQGTQPPNAKKPEGIKK